MSEVLKTELYQGPTIQIVVDEDVRSPFANKHEVHLAGWHDKYVNPTEDFKDPQAVLQYARETGAYLLKIYLYDHSATVYRLANGNPFSDPWDAGWFGYLIVEKSYLEQHGWQRVSPSLTGSFWSG